jgi:hypothetical protein
VMRTLNVQLYDYLDSHKFSPPVSPSEAGVRLQ